MADDDDVIVREDKWQRDFNWRSAVGLIVFLAIVISMLTTAIRGDSKEIDAKQTTNIDAQEKRIDRLEYSIGKNDAYMEAVQASLARIEADTKESLKRIEADIKEIKDKQ